MLASVSAGAPEQASMRVMRRLYRLLLLSLHEHRQDEREREEASQPGEGRATQRSHAEVALARSSTSCRNSLFSEATAF